MPKPHVVLIAMSVAAVAGCGGSRLQNASVSVWGGDLAAVGPPGYSLTVSVLGDPVCHNTPPDTSFTMTLDDGPLASRDCLAGDSGYFKDGPFTIRIRDGADSAQIVVTDLFPGLQAAVINSMGGPFAPGASFDVTVPPALQFEAPARFGAQFMYLDADDPAYVGDATTPTAGNGVIHVPAPQHAGHFSLWITLATPVSATGPDEWSPKATVVSCSGVSSCAAFAAPDLGPLAVEVGAPPP